MVHAQNSTSSIKKRYLCSEYAAMNMGGTVNVFGNGIKSQFKSFIDAEINLP